MDKKEIARDRARKWYYANKERALLNQSKRKEEIKKYTRKYFLDNKEKLYANRKERIKRFPWVRVFYTISSRCGGHDFYKRKGIKCRIRISELKTLWERDQAHLLKFPSIDRKDRNGDYTFENCQFIELKDNLARRLMFKGKRK